MCCHGKLLILTVYEMRAYAMETFGNIVLLSVIQLVLFGFFGPPNPDTPNTVELNVFKKATGESVNKFNLTSFRASEDLVRFRYSKYYLSFFLSYFIGNCTVMRPAKIVPVFRRLG